MATFLYASPLYTGSVILSYFLIAILLCLGVIGLGIELNKLGDGTVKLGFDDLGLGLGFGLVWLVIYYFFPIWWINLFNMPFLFLSIYGTTLGGIKIFRNLFLTKKEFLVKLPIVIFQLTAFVAAVATIFNILKLN